MIVTSGFRDLDTPAGVMRVHTYTPVASSERSFPGLLLYPEIFQQTGPITRLATQFASHGYVVVAPEIFHEHEPPGTVLAYDDAGRDRGNFCKYGTAISTFDHDASLCIELLSADPSCNGSIGTVGFCIGGHLAFRAALDPRVLAACCFYPTDIHNGEIGLGRSADTLGRVAAIAGELVMVFGRQDPHVPQEGRRRIHDALSAAEVHFSWHELNAQHAFMRDEGARYDAEASALGMAIALALFGRAL